MDSDTDTVVSAKCVAVLALTAVRALRVDALAAARVDYTLVNICKLQVML